MDPHPTRLWGLTPNSVMNNFGVEVQVNDVGLRSSVTPSHPEYRWMVLGDSSFFGHGLRDDQTLHVQLQEQWKERGLEVAALCGGIPGYSVLQTELMMNEVGWNQHPDLLVIGNLWSDNNFDYFVDELWLAQLNSPSAKLSRWFNRFWFWRLLSLKLRAVPNQSEGDIQNRRISWVREPLQTGTRRVELSLYAQVLDRLLLEAARRQVGVVMVRPANRHRIEGEPADAMWAPYFKAQRQVAERRSVPILDVATVFQLFGLGPDQAFLDAMHPTEKGNYWLASSLVDLALSEGWPENKLIPDMSAPLFSEELPDPYQSEGEFFSPVESR